jgi:hypothetical protein
MDMSFGTWNVRSIYRSDSLKIISRELAKYKLDLVGAQEVRWDMADNYTLFYGNGNADRHFGTGLFVHKGIILATKWLEFVNDWMSDITLRDHWCDFFLF